MFLLSERYILYQANAIFCITTCEHIKADLEHMCKDSIFHVKGEAESYLIKMTRPLTSGGHIFHRNNCLREGQVALAIWNFAAGCQCSFANLSKKNSFVEIFIIDISTTLLNAKCTTDQLGCKRNGAQPFYIILAITRHEIYWFPSLVAHFAQYSNEIYFMSLYLSMQLN